MLKLITILTRVGACAEAKAWARTQPDLGTAWKTCHRSEWMIWLLARTTIDLNDSRLRLMACDFADAVLHLVPPGEDRPRNAIAVARKFAAGEAGADELTAAWDAARDAASAAAWDAARDAASAAAWAAASAAAWDAARDAASAAAWDAARDAASAAARDAAWAAQADIIRSYFPDCPPINPDLFRRVRS